MFISCEQKSRKCSFQTQTFDIVIYTKMSYEKNFEFTAAVRGYHYYRRFWAPKPLQQLYCFFEDDSPFDQFAMKVCEEEGQKTPIGHLPREFSRAMKFLIDRGANITVTLRNDHYRRSPLVQGGMEIA